jgi:hypothetical protein
MKKTILIALALIIFLVPTIVSAQGSITIESIQNFTSPMIGGNTYNAKIKLTSYSYTDIPLLFRFIINTSSPIEYPEFNLVAGIDSLSLVCNKTLANNNYSMIWECLNGTSYYNFVSGSVRYLDLNLSLHVAASSQSSLNWALEILVDDTLPPIITLVSPANNSVIKSGTLLNLTVTDNVNVGRVSYSKLLFEDNFNDGNYNGWSVISGAYSANSSELSRTSGMPAIIVTNDSITGNGVFEFNIRPNESTDYGKGMYIRYNDTNGFTYWVELDGQRIHIYKNDGSGWHSVNSTPVSYLLNGTQYKIKAVVNQSKIDVYFERMYEPVLSYTDPSPISGNKIGFRAWQKVSFDDVKVTDVESLLFFDGVNSTNVSINTTGLQGGSTNFVVFASDKAGNQNQAHYHFIFDNTPPRVENSTINKTIREGQNETIMVDVVDKGNSSVDKVLVEDYLEKYKFDFQPAGSPVEENYTMITRTMLYNSSTGYGWLASPIDDRDRGSGSYPENLTRDFIFDSVNRTFIVDLPNGNYIVTVLLGDMSYAHDLMNVYANDQLKLSGVNTSAGEIKWLDFFVPIDNGQLNITFSDTGGSIHWTCPGLIIKSYVKTYEMKNEIGSTYLVKIPYPTLGLHSIRYVANDTVGNVNDTVLDSYNVTLTPPPKVISIVLSPSVTNGSSIFVGEDNITFDITFNEEMNNSIQPIVKFGLSPIIIDDGDSGYSDTDWTLATGQGYDLDVRYKAAGTGLHNATWTPNIPVTGNYSVYVSWTTHPNRATNANYTIFYNGGSYSFIVNQENHTNGTTGGSAGEWSGWYYAGTFNFTAGTSGRVVLNDNANEYVIADAVKFESKKENFVTGNWTNTTLWSGKYYINSGTGDGLNTLSISNARNIAGKVMVTNDTFMFTIDTSLPRVVSVVLDPSVNNTYVKTGNISFTINFNRIMNTSVPLNVTFGQYSPYLQNTLIGNWTNGNTWKGYYNVTNSTLPGDGIHRLRIADGKDLLNKTIVTNTSFTFYIDTQNPVARNPKVPNISFTQNETITVQAYDLGSGIDNVTVRVYNATYDENYTMQLAYNDYMVIGYLTFAPIGTYYIIIPNTSIPRWNGTYNYTFFVTDKSGNMNNSLSGNFTINGTSVKTGGNIAFLCRGDPVGSGNITTQTCNYGIENQTILWLRSQNWTVYVQRYDLWNSSYLSTKDLIVCSDENFACNPTSAVTTAHKTYGKPFVEIPTFSEAYAGYKFGYLNAYMGISNSGETNLYVTVGDSITSGYIGNVTIYNATNKGIGTMRDYTLMPQTLKVADISSTYRAYDSSLFKVEQKVEQNGTQGRYAWVGWFNGQSFSFPPFYYYFYGWTPYDLNPQGQLLLKRTLNWAQCGNTMGCVTNSLLTTSVTNSLLTISTTTTSTSTTTSTTITTLPITTTSTTTTTIPSCLPIFSSCSSNSQCCSNICRKSLNGKICWYF